MTEEHIENIKKKLDNKEKVILNHKNGDNVCVIGYQFLNEKITKFLCEVQEQFEVREQDGCGVSYRTVIKEYLPELLYEKISLKEKYKEDVKCISRMYGDIFEGFFEPKEGSALQKAINGFLDKIEKDFNIDIKV